MSVEDGGDGKSTSRDSRLIELTDVTGEDDRAENWKRWLRLRKQQAAAGGFNLI